MAVSTDNYYSNSIVGQPQVGADIDIYETSSSPKYAIGFGFTRGDGNKYRYGHFGELTNRGALVGTDVSESGLAKIEDVGALVANLTTRGSSINAPNAVGARYMQLVITATANQFTGGYITITTGTGAGYTYRIRGNTATSAGSPVTGNIYLDLWDKIQVAIDSNSDIAIAGSSYANLEAALSSDNPVPVGVAVTGNTITDYGWIQTAGVGGVLQDVSIFTIGSVVTVSSNTAGAVTNLPTTSSGSVYAAQAVVGYGVEPGSSADYSIVNLTLE